MPGVHVDLDFSGARSSGESWLRALEATRAGDSPPAHTRFEDERVRIGSTEYPGYPIETRENDRTFVCLEGRVYDGGHDALIERLLEFGAAPGRPDDDRSLGPLLRDLDADCIAVVYAKATGRLWLSVDSLGRLPLYAWRSPSRLVLSRDQRFICTATGAHAVDRIGLAHLLLFGYPIGRETLIEGVERMTPGHDFSAGPDGLRESAGVLGGVRLDQKDRAGHPFTENVADLEQLLVQSCRARRDAAPAHLLSLSGGIDSRAVGAAMVRASIPFDAATFLDSAGVYRKEVSLAREIAARLGAPWRRFELPAPAGSSLHRMLQLKLGLNSLGESYDIDLFAALHAAYGDRLAFWSGDGGDKILPDQRPWLSSEGRAGIAEYIVAKNQVWELDEVAWLTGVPAGEVLAGVDAVVRGYPESSPAQKYVRFMLAERAFRWISEGEDCNRHHYWTVSPFHSLPVFRAAMACPDDQKSGYRLYRALLRRMMPAVAAVADANLGMPMSSPLYPWYRRARELSRRLPRLQRLVRRGRMVSPLGPQSLRIAEVLRRQAQSSPSVRSCFSPTALESAIANADRKTPYALECLLTATSAVEEIAEGRSTLSDFADRPFG